MANRLRLAPIIVVGSVFLAILVTFRAVAVLGDSMAPSLRDGQWVLAVSPRLLRRPVQRGDVVLIRRGSEILVKRVVYLPRDRVSAMDRPLLQAVRDYFETDRSEDQLRVPDGRVVVMGDNRSVSDDSRRFGPVPVSDIVGFVLFAPSSPESRVGLR